MHTGSQAGLDSLGAVDLRNACIAQFAIDLPPSLAFDYPTAAALSAAIASRLGPEQALQRDSPSSLQPGFLTQMSQHGTAVVGAASVFPGPEQGEHSLLKQA